MNTMTMTPRTEPGLVQQLLSTLKARRGQITPLASIIAIHLVLFYMLQSGLLHKVMHVAMPQVINVSFVAPPAPPKTPPAPPKTVQIAHKAPTITPPPLPLLAVAPIEPTITPPQPPAPAAPATQAVATTAPVAVSAPAPTPPAAPRTVSDVEYLRAPQPVYPNISRRLGESGTVVLRILIGEKGLPEQVLVQKSSGFSNLDEAGRQAAMRALFKPHLEDGKPVAVYVIVPLNFQLS